jgi:phage minor structural protein
VGTVSYPILYSATETTFNHNGLGILSDCLSCEVVEEANGIFELSMQYSSNGIHYDEIVDRSIIKAKIDNFREPQLFRIYSIKKTISGVLSIMAQHISYDLSGIPIPPFSASSVTSALNGFKEKAVVTCPFDFWTDKPTTGDFKVEVPASIRSRLGGVEGSILDVYGGEYEFDNYTVKLHNNRGQNRGVSIRYGKNLTDFNQEQKCASVATGVYPYWAGVENEENVLVQLPEKIVYAQGTYNFVKIKTLDLSSAFQTKPTEQMLRKATENYIKQNNIGVPEVSLTVSFVQLEQSEEYKHLALLERISLFDTVNVEFPAFGVSATAKAVKMVFDVLAERVKNVTIGSVRANIANTIANQNKEIQDKPNKNDVKTATQLATEWLTNGKGYKVERRDENGNTIDTLYLDTPDIETAKNVLRIGQSGIGFSKSGVAGPYYSAWTIDGKFNADFITTGSVVSQDGTFEINLNEGKISIFGKRVYGEKSYQQKNIFSNNGIEGFGEDGNGELVQTLVFSNGVSDAPTMIFNPYGYGIEVFSMNGVSRFGSTSAKSEMIGSMVEIKSISGTKIENKRVSWEQRADGKFILVGE